MNIVLIASDGNCGIYEYSQILLEGFRQASYQARYIGVRKRDDASLAAAVKQIRSDEEVVVFEYEAGIFRLGALVKAMLRLRLRRKGIVLSIHEIELPKFSEYRSLNERLAYTADASLPGEFLSLVGRSFGLGATYARLRLLLLLFGALPNVVVVHSPKAEEGLALVLGDRRKVKNVPHVVKQLEGDRDSLRRELGLPLDRFIFIVPGFLFRRKRIVEVIEALPEEAVLLVVGTESQWDPGYLKEIEVAVAGRPQARASIVRDYENMERYLLASDAVVLFYSDSYQSGVACLALGAGKPCVFSDLPAFRAYEGAGLYVSTREELSEAMRALLDQPVYNRMLGRVKELREALSPEKIARQYLD